MLLRYSSTIGAMYARFSCALSMLFQESPDLHAHEEVVDVVRNEILVFWLEAPLQLRTHNLHDIVELFEILVSRSWGGRLAICGIPQVASRLAASLV